MVTNSQGSAGLEIRFRTGTAFLSQDLKSEGLKLALTSRFSLINLKNIETMKTFHFLSCQDIQMTIITFYFGIRVDVIKMDLIKIKIGQDGRNEYG